MPCILSARTDSAATLHAQSYPMMPVLPQDGIQRGWWHLKALLADCPGQGDWGAWAVPSSPALCKGPILPYKVWYNLCGLMGSHTVPWQRDSSVCLTQEAVRRCLPPPGHSLALSVPMVWTRTGWIPCGWGGTQWDVPGGSNTARRGRAVGRDLPWWWWELDLIQAWGHIVSKIQWLGVAFPKQRAL